MATPARDPLIEARAHVIARHMPDEFPYGYAYYLAEQEAEQAKEQQ